MQTHPASIADDSARLLQAYIADAQRHAIPAKDQKDLWAEYKACADPARKLKLRNRLFEANLMLVVFFVSKWNKGRPRLMDLIQEGNLGLLRAIEKFEPERKLSFGTYAVNWIRAFTSLASKRMASPVHVPAAKLRCEDIPQGVSLNFKANEETDVSLLDTMTSDLTQETEYLEKEDKETAHRRIRAIADRILTDREIHVLEHYILPDRDEADTLKVISERYGVSREAIRQWSLKVQAKLERALTHEPATLAHVRTRVRRPEINSGSTVVTDPAGGTVTVHYSTAKQLRKGGKVQRRRKGTGVRKLASKSNKRKGRQGKAGRKFKKLDGRRTAFRRKGAATRRTGNRSRKSKVANKRGVRAPTKTTGRGRRS